MTPKRPDATCLIAEFFESPCSLRPGEAFRIFAAFAGVGLAADAVHRDRERFVRFLRDGAVGHRAGLEALHDRFHGLDFLDRNRSVAVLEIEQRTQRAEILALLVDHLRVRLVGRLAVLANRFLQRVHGLRSEEVCFAVGAPLVLAADGQHVTVDGPFRIRSAMPQRELPAR